MPINPNGGSPSYMSGATGNNDIWGGLFGGIRDWFNQPAGNMNQGSNVVGNPASGNYATPSYMSGAGGGSDVSPMSSSTPTPNAGGGSFSGGETGSFTPDPSMPSAGGSGGASQQPGVSQAMTNAFMQQMSTHAMDPNLVAQTMQSLMGVTPPDYLKTSQAKYQEMVNTLNNIKAGVNQGYDQVGSDIGDMYKANQGAMTMGANNILTQLAKGQGDAIQGGAQNNVNALANLKNAELATRAAVAQQGGVAQAGSDIKTDPADVAAAGTLANAQQAANNAQAQATQDTNLNNGMAAGMGVQNAIAQQQLANERLGYNSSMGTRLADMANQEATREIEAQKQMYQDALARTQAMYGISKDQASLDIQKMGNLVGNKGFMSALQDIGAYNLDNSKAMAQATGGGNVNPASTALIKYPQFGQAYNNALAKNLQLMPGTKPTPEDLYRAMYNDPSLQGSNISGNDLANFTQMALANKANSPYDDLMLAMQGQ